MQCPKFRVACLGFFILHQRLLHLHPFSFCLVVLFCEFLFLNLQNKVHLMNRDVAQMNDDFITSFMVHYVAYFFLPTWRLWDRLLLELVVTVRRVEGSLTCLFHRKGRTAVTSCVVQVQYFSDGLLPPKFLLNERGTSNAPFLRMGNNKAVASLINSL